MRPKSFFYLPVTATVTVLLLTTIFTGCRTSEPERAMRTVTDQLGRQVNIPVQPDQIAALHHFGGKIVYALNQQHRLVEKSIYGMEAKALAETDPSFAALPGLIQGHGYNIEGMVALGPQVIFSYASMDRSEIRQFEDAGIPVVAVKGETFAESFEAVRLIADVLGCPDAGKTADTLTDTVLTQVLGENIQLDVTTKGVFVAVPRTIPPKMDDLADQSLENQKPYNKKVSV